MDHIGLIHTCVLLLAACLGIQGADRVGFAPLSDVSFPVTARSRTGQFIIRGGRSNPNDSPATAIDALVAPGRFSRIRPAASGDSVTLSPALVSVSCERIKAGLIRLLALPEGHHGRILVFIGPSHPASQPLLIQSTPFADGWQYSLTVPETIAWPRFVRAIVEAVLLDAANPDPGANLAPIPLWLSEGSSFLLVNNAGPELVPEPNREFKDPLRHLDPSAAIMNRLEGQAPMDFSALSLPSDSTLADAAKFSTFQASSALLVHELGRMGAPQRPIRSLIEALQGHLNWQTAMLEAWRDRFQSLLEIEKWWAVQSTSRLLRNPGRLWSRQATLAQLTAVLTETAAAATGTNGPVPRTQRLSEVVLQWPYPAQADLLDRKILQLRNLFLFADPDLLDLVRQSHSTLQEHRILTFFQKALVELPNPRFIERVLTSYVVAACGSG